MRKHFEGVKSPFEIVYDKDIDVYTRVTKKALQEELNYHILAVCVMHEKITHAEGERLYNLVNYIKSKPSSQTFATKMKKSWEYFSDSGYIKVLKLSHYSEYE